MLKGQLSLLESKEAAWKSPLISLTLSVQNHHTRLNKSSTSQYKSFFDRRRWEEGERPSNSVTAV